MRESFEPSADLPDLAFLDSPANTESLLETPIPGVTPTSTPPVDGIQAKATSPFRPLLTDVSRVSDQGPDSDDLGLKVQDNRDYGQGIIC